jgi:hypothetical protein
MDSFQVCQLVIVRINTYTEEETRVSPVDNLVIAELGKCINQLRSAAMADNAPRQSWTGISDLEGLPLDAPLPSAAPINIFPSESAGERDTSRQNLFVIVVRDIPFGKSRLSLAVLVSQGYISGCCQGLATSHTCTRMNLIMTVTNQFQDLLFSGAFAKQSFHVFTSQQLEVFAYTLYCFYCYGS